MSRIPSIPGTLVPSHSEHERWLRGLVANLCRLEHDRHVSLRSCVRRVLSDTNSFTRFPGSQPISFSLDHLDELEKRDYWVCEKSDGVRVLFFLQTDPTGSQAVYLIDRHNTYHEVSGFWFPRPDRPKESLMDTILDGELVIDVDPQSKREVLRYLAFDCLVFNGERVMSKPLDKRYWRLKEQFYVPWSGAIKELPQLANSIPFDIKVKNISFSYGIEDVFRNVIPSLQHGNDGLIYTCTETPYVPGTDPNILKWKPPSENSIDFKLVLRFPPSKSIPSQPNFCAKPFFGLHIYCGEERGQTQYEPYDELYVDDDEWQKMKLSGEQVDDRIVEVHWDPELSRWRMMRFRDDKPHGNYRTVVEKIIQSIADGVEKSALLARAPAIRAAWKARHAQSRQQNAGARPPVPPPPPPPSQLSGHCAQEAPTSNGHPTTHPPPPVPLRYGPIATSRWSKVSGPGQYAGMQR
ncbi:mRNA capping enzyme [Scleroderma citrinum]